MTTTVVCDVCCCCGGCCCTFGGGVLMVSRIFFLNWQCSLALLLVFTLPIIGPMQRNWPCLALKEMYSSCFTVAASQQGIVCKEAGRADRTNSELAVVALLVLEGNVSLVVDGEEVLGGVVAHGDLLGIVRLVGCCGQTSSSGGAREKTTYR